MDHLPDAPVEPPRPGRLPTSEETIDETVGVIRQLLERRDHASAWDKFLLLHPADQAEALRRLPRRLRQSLRAEMSAAVLASLLEFLEPEGSVELLGGTAVSGVAETLDLASPDVAADILQLLPVEQRMETLSAMRESAEVEALLAYRDDSAGGLMTPDFPVVLDSTNPAKALDQLRLLGPSAESIDSVLVVNGERQLVGSVSLVRLALARPTSPIRDIMDSPVQSVYAETDQEECARVMERYNLSRLPVVDTDGKLTGVILAEDIVDVVEEEATEDMFRMASVGQERVLGPLRGSFRSRLPWLLINLGTAFLAALMVSLFESTIAKVVALAVFLPVVAGQGGIGRHPNGDLGGARHGTGRRSTAAGIQDFAPGVDAGRGPRAGAGGDSRGSGLGLERERRAGVGAGSGHAGKHAGGGRSRSGGAVAAAPTGDGPCGVIGSVRDHLHRCSGLSAVSRLGRRDDRLSGLTMRTLFVVPNIFSRGPLYNGSHY